MYQIDDKVTGNPKYCAPNDMEIGRVIEVEGDQITVAWDSGVRTTQSADLLSPTTGATQTSYTTVTDARDALGNSGVVEWFEYDDLDKAAEWMWRNDATPEQAAKHFGVD